MVDLAIIERVNGILTKWVSPMMVVPKSMDDIRISIDMRQVNTAIIRECHLIPAIDEVLFELNSFRQSDAYMRQ